MATRLAVRSVKVLDQKEVLEFYVNKLGLEKGADIKQGPLPMSRCATAACCSTGQHAAAAGCVTSSKGLLGQFPSGAAASIWSDDTQSLTVGS